MNVLYWSSVIFFTGIFIVILLFFLNWLSYTFSKNKVLRRRIWDLNICCGKTDGGGYNADIVKHADVNNFILIKDIYRLPFKDKQFPFVLCSHTLEHIDDPAAFHRELNRVGQNVTYLLPPIWDISAALNFIEHRWLFLSFFTEHQRLPKYIRLPFARSYQKYFGQRIKA